MQDVGVPQVISYYVHEAEIARSEAHAKRWMIAALIMFIALVLTNAGWLIHESQFADEVVTQEVTQDANGGGSNVNNLYSGDYYGETDSQNNDTT